MKKSTRLVAVFLALIVGSLTSCGGPHSVKPSPHKNIGSKTNVEVGSFIGDNLKYYKQTPVNGGKPITLKAYINEDWASSYNYLFSEYQRIHPNVKIEVTKFPWNTYWKKLNLAMKSNDGPDIFHMHNSYTKDMLPYLEEFPENTIPFDMVEKDFSAPEITKINGKIYFMNIGMSTGGVFYNKDMWSKAGLTDKDIPQTWDELRKVAQKLTKYDKDDKIIVDGFNFNETEEFLLLALQLQKNMPAFSVETGMPKFDSVENVKNIQFLRKMETIDKICRSDAGPAWDLFGSEHAAMIYSWSWVGNVLNQYYQKVNYGFFSMPVWDKGKTTVYERNNYECTFGVNNSASKERMEVSFDIMKFYLCNEDILQRVAEQAQLVPSKHSLMENKSLKENFIISQQMKYINKTTFMELNSRHINDILKTSLGVNIMNPYLTPQEVLSGTDTEIEKILSKE